MFIVMLQRYSATPTPEMDEMAVTLGEWGHRVIAATPDRQSDMETRKGAANTKRGRKK